LAEVCFGDKSGKTGNAASSSGKIEVSGELQAALDKIAPEKEFLAQFLQPLTRTAKGRELASPWQTGLFCEVTPAVLPAARQGFLPWQAPSP
jgi:hypothetical protein